MKINYGPRGILEIDDARIIYRNFEGRGSKYNREGDRNFAVIIPDTDDANELIEAGWNVKIKPPRDEQETPFIFLPIKVKFNDRGPRIHLVTGDRVVELNEETVGCIDDIDIIGVDLDVRPYDWEVNGKAGRAAYLQSMEVSQRIDRFEARRMEGSHDDNL